jgi:hypothetical protein
MREPTDALAANGTTATLKRGALMSAFSLLSAIGAKVLNSTEGAHLINMSTFEAHEHLQEMCMAFAP